MSGTGSKPKLLLMLYSDFLGLPCEAGKTIEDNENKENREDEKVSMKNPAEMKCHKEV